MKGHNCMLKAARLFKAGFIAVLVGVIVCQEAWAAEAVEFKRNKTSLGRDVFEQNIFYEGTHWLRLDRLYRGIFHKKQRAKDVNVFDEVPDNTFFTNRRGRKALSRKALTRGFRLDDGPDTTGALKIQKAKFGEINSRIWVKDLQGNAYLLKFDPADYLGSPTGAELIANRIYYALGYNVSQNTLLEVGASQLVPDEGAQVSDGTGFTKPLTSEKLQEYLLFIPQTDEEEYRALASKIIPGELRGAVKFQGRRRNDPDDLYDHENRRTLRALRVFASWLNHTDLRPENYLDVLQEEDGKRVLKHYVIDTDCALGAEAYGAKPPHFGHEYFIDYGETLKAIFSLGLWEKPWQARWRENQEKTYSSAVGYFDNHHFNPGKFRPQLPSYAFKDLTRADGFWAAKLIMSFTNKDIAALAKAGEYSRSVDEEYIAKVLTTRRDLVGRYWFSQAAPLDQFDLQGSKLVFEDLAVKYGFENQGIYHAEVFSKIGKKRKKITEVSVNTPEILLQDSWISSGSQSELSIRVSRSQDAPRSPYVRVQISGGNISGIAHQD